jgi:hypothetical protein
MNNYGAFVNGRNTLNFQVVLNGSGGFDSNYAFNIEVSDYGEGPKRILTLYIGGNVKLYILVEETCIWSIVWMVIPGQFSIHGFSGI